MTDPIKQSLSDKLWVKTASFENLHDCCKKLHKAAATGHAWRVDYILDRFGEDIPQPTVDKALYVAALRGHYDAIDVLLDWSGDLRIGGDVLMQHAAEKGDDWLFEACMKAGANIFAEDEKALRHAAEKGHSEIVDMILEKSTCTTPFKERAMQSAAAKGHKYIVRTLKKWMQDHPARTKMVGGKKRQVLEKGSRSVLEKKPKSQRTGPMPAPKKTQAEAKQPTPLQVAEANRRRQAAQAARKPKP